MKKLLFALPLIALCSVAIGQEPAKVTVTIKVPANIPSFKSQKLEVLLLQANPRQSDRRPFFADKFINNNFSHTMGKETVVTIVLGEKVKVDPLNHYSVTVFVLDAANKRTHFGDTGDETNAVLTRSAPNNVTFTVRPVAKD